MEDLQIKLTQNLGLIPEVLGYLASIKEFEYSYKHYNLRHPGGIFNLVTNYALNDLLELLKELEEHQSNFKENSLINLEKKFKNLINSFFKFYDSCFEIMLGCCKEHSPPEEKEFSWKWLKKNRYNVGEEFYNKTKEEINYLRKTYNKLKHSSNAIQPINFHKNNLAIMGYYLQSVAKDGSVGPDEELHPKHQNTHSANSYNLALKKLHYLFYFVSEVLKETLLQHFQKVYNVNLGFNEDYKTDDKIWRNVAERIAKLPDAYFPIEFGEEIPEIEIRDKEILFQIQSIKPTNLFNYVITFMESGDGFTRSFRMPFYNPQSRTNIKLK